MILRTSFLEESTYGYQSQEKDDEIKGKGNSVNFTFRMYDTRLGRFLSTDPLGNYYSWNSPYSFAENSVIEFRELEGAEKVHYGNYYVGAKRIASALKQAEFVPQDYNPAGLAGVENYQGSVGVKGDVANNFWINTENGRAMTLKNPNTKASKAFDNTLSNVPDFSIGCAIWAQMVRIGALREGLGTDKFNAYIKEQSEPFTIRVSGSTGLNSKSVIMPNGKKGFLATFTDREVKSILYKNEKEMLKALEVGSEIALRNKNVPGSVNYRLNVVKIGDDAFVAKGFETPLSYDELVKQLVKTINEKIEWATTTYNPEETYSKSGNTKEENVQYNKDVHANSQYYLRRGKAKAKNITILRAENSTISK